MAVNRDEFFREVTLRICSSLQINTAFGRVFEYLREHFPIDDGPLNLDEAMSLQISKVLKLTKGKIHGPGGAAELLGINPNTLRGRISKLGIVCGRKQVNP